MKIKKSDLPRLMQMFRQMVRIREFEDNSEAMLKEGISDPKVFLAMGVLVENFMARKLEVRKEFAQRFADFSSKEVEKEFRKLVGREKQKHVSAVVTD